MFNRTSGAGRSNPFETTAAAASTPQRAPRADEGSPAPPQAKKAKTNLDVSAKAPARQAAAKESAPRRDQTAGAEPPIHIEDLPADTHQYISKFLSIDPHPITEVLPRKVAYGGSLFFKHETPAKTTTGSDMYNMAIAFGKPATQDMNIPLGARAELKELKDKYCQIIERINSIVDLDGFLSAMGQLSSESNPLEKSILGKHPDFDQTKLESLLADRYAYLPESDRKAARKFCQDRVKTIFGQVVLHAKEADNLACRISPRIEGLEEWAAKVGGFHVLLANEGENVAALARRLGITDPYRIAEMEMASLFGHAENFDGPVAPRVRRRENLVQLADQYGITSQYGLFRMENLAQVTVIEELVKGSSTEEAAAKVGIVTPMYLRTLEDYACALSGMNVDSILDARRNAPGELNLYADPRRNMEVEYDTDDESVESQDSENDRSRVSLETDLRNHLEWIAMTPARQKIQSGMSVEEAAKIHGIKHSHLIDDLHREFSGTAPAQV